MNVALALIAGYLIGGIPTGILICRAVAGVDPRSLGSGSSGATNVSRVIGRPWASAVLFLDALKGFLPVLFLVPAIGSPDNENLVRGAMALGAVSGHIWTPYASFHGGKGIATGAGALLALDVTAALTALAVWVLVFVLFRRVSLASIVGAISASIAVIVMGGRPTELVIAVVVLTLLLIFTHRENIHRLVTGCERPIV